MNQHSIKAPAIAIAVVVALTGSGCLTYDGNRAIVPLLEIYDQEAKLYGPGKADEIPAASEPAPRSREVVLRPLGSVELIGDSPETRRHRLKLLWPLADFAWGQGNTRLWTMPVFYYRNKPLLTTEGADLDWLIFPILFGGHDPREGGYFAFFPLAGKIRGLLGKDETHFFLFPLYWRSWEGEYDSLHVLVPLFNRVRGDGHRGWRLWPFYGWYDATRVEDGRPRYRLRFIGWPFYIRQDTNLDSKRPNNLLFCFPFYGQSINPRTETRTYLWPFFHVSQDMPTGNKLYFGYLLPYRFTGGQFDLWPLFGWKTRKYHTGINNVDMRGIAGPGGMVNPLDASFRAETGAEEPSIHRTRYRQFALWPIQRYDSEYGDTWERHKLWVLPLFWRFYTHDHRRAIPTSSELKVWPLWRYRRVGESSSLYLPSPLWFRQENLFERLYARLWRLFLYKNNDERRGWEFLYGFLSYRHEKREADRTFSIFYGLLEWGASKEGHRLRFLYLPWR